jgi:hypothetical protein
MPAKTVVSIPTNQIAKNNSPIHDFIHTSCLGERRNTKRENDPFGTDLRFAFPAMVDTTIPRIQKVRPGRRESRQYWE